MKLNKKAIFSTIGAALVVAVALVGCGAHKNSQKAKSTQPKSNATSQAFKEDADKKKAKAKNSNDNNEPKNKANAKKNNKTKQPKANKIQRKPILKTKHSVIKNNLRNNQVKNGKQVPNSKARAIKIAKIKNIKNKINAQRNMQAYYYVDRYAQTPQGQKMVAKTNYNRKGRTANIYLQPQFIKQLNSLDKQCKNLPKMNKRNGNIQKAQANKNQSQHLLAQATALNKEINNTLLAVNNKQTRGLKIRIVNGNRKSLAQINKHGLDLQRNIQTVYKHDVKRLLDLDKINKAKKVNPKLKKSVKNTQQTE